MTNRNRDRSIDMIRGAKELLHSFSFIVTLYYISIGSIGLIGPQIGATPLLLIITISAIIYATRTRITIFFKLISNINYTTALFLFFDITLALFMIIYNIPGPTFIIKTIAFIDDPCTNKANIGLQLCASVPFGFSEASFIFDPSDETAQPFAERSAQWKAEMEAKKFRLSICGYQGVQKIRNHEFMIIDSCE